MIIRAKEQTWNFLVNNEMSWKESACCAVNKELSWKDIACCADSFDEISWPTKIFGDTCAKNLNHFVFSLL